MDDGLEILTTSETAAADRAAIAAGTPGRVLMERAGQAVADAIEAWWSPRNAVVLCGPGNNGGDGFVVARLLDRAGWPVRLALLGERDALTGDAAVAAADWDGGVGALSPAVLDGAELVVDALFGAGLSKPLSPEVRQVLEAAEHAGLPIVAIDLPSGLPGDRAAPLAYAPHVALTVTFHRKKPAHVLEPGRSFCGEIVVADIGLAAPRAATLFENGPGLWLDRFPWPATGTHKHQRGRLGVVSGQANETGAARLAARAGLRLAGAVTVFCPAAAAATVAAHLEAVMLKPFDGAGDLAARAAEMDAIVIGPAAGLDALTVANLEAVSRAGAALVVDADALTIFKGRADALFALVDDRDVLTPHAGEFERIFPGLLDRSPERIEAAREAARQAGAVVLLKGADTVVAAPDGRAAVTINATPWLATAGSGDVLCGIIGSLLAGHVPAFEAACMGAWIHGEAGSAFGPGLTAEDLPGLVPGVLRALRDLADGSS
jgi:ADP-dependent NAD(P)H-hydrate dehydratase / NAD(P)H-hydrate epimerase